MKNKRFMILMLVLVLVLTACGGGGTTKAPAANEDSDEIVIGVMGPLTGNVAIYGIASTNGTKQAIDEINANGGILGKQVRLVIEDEKGDTQEAVNVYNKIAESGAAAIIGSITSGPTLAVAELANRDNMLLITPTGTQLDITEGRPSVFRVCFTDPFQGEILAQYAKETLGASTAAVLSNNSSDYSQGVKDAFVAEAAAQGITIVGDESYGNDDKDFRVQLTTIAAGNPDVILIPDYYQVIALIAPQAREVGLTGTFVGPDGWDGVIEQLTTGLSDDALKAEALESVEGSLFTNHYSLDDPDENIQAFIKNYSELYGENPASFAALGYDAAYMVKQAIEEAGSTDSQAIIDAMKNIDYSGITGSIKFDDNNNPIKAVSVIEVTEGVYKLDSVVTPQ
ncbi:MAG: ABC transporter substrate-binding protein [Tissierellia bacterium]|nr:ABC transporter substrate-binding protein [Tissierellia bacterium]